jgi:hypothetical protein
VRRTARNIDFSDIPEASLKQLRAMQRVEIRCRAKQRVGGCDRD